MACEAKKAQHSLSRKSVEERNSMLNAIAKNIEAHKENIYATNKIDLEAAQKLVENGEISSATYGRLKLDENKMRDMIQGIYDIINLEDPINTVFWRKKLDDDFVLEKISCPIGVIGVIFEARPDVISQISALAIKTGNSVILKGGKESNFTNNEIAKIIKDTLNEFGAGNVVSLLHSREDVAEMLKCEDCIDLIIPRGSNELVKYIQQNTKIPVLGHASGVCHIFVDESADLEMAKRICIDAKIQYPSACNAVETILIHKNFPYFDELKNALINADIEIVEGEEFWGVEFSEKKAAIKVVEGLSEAIEHINKYGSHHTDSIITANNENAECFMNDIDCAGVFHNCSTRFSDGFRYGFGAEVGISTNKTHARGPVGLSGLTIYKYKLRGIGNIVADYANGNKKFKHELL